MTSFLHLQKPLPPLWDPFVSTKTLPFPILATAFLVCSQDISSDLINILKNFATDEALGEDLWFVRRCCHHSIMPTTWWILAWSGQTKSQASERRFQKATAMIKEFWNIPLSALPSATPREKCYLTARTMRWSDADRSSAQQNLELQMFYSSEGAETFHVWVFNSGICGMSISRSC